MEKIFNTIGEYNKSPSWKKKSRKLLENRDLVCPICKRERWVWQPRKKQWKRKIRFVTHHITYENVPNEKAEDLITLCGICHEFCHKALQYEKWGGMYKEIAKVVKNYFDYKGAETLKRGVGESEEAT